MTFEHARFMVFGFGLGALLVACASLYDAIGVDRTSPEFVKACTGIRVALTGLDAVQNDPRLTDPEVKRGFLEAQMALRYHLVSCPPEAMAE